MVVFNKGTKREHVITNETPIKQTRRIDEEEYCWNGWHKPDIKRHRIGAEQYQFQESPLPSLATHVWYCRDCMIKAGLIW